MTDTTGSLSGENVGVRVHEAVTEGEKPSHLQRAWILEPCLVARTQQWDMSRICGLASQTLDASYDHYENLTTTYQYSTGYHFSPLQYGTGHTVSYTVMSDQGKAVIGLVASPLSHLEALSCNFKPGNVVWNFLVLEAGDTM